GGADSGARRRWPGGAAGGRNRAAGGLRRGWRSVTLLASRLVLPLPVGLVQRVLDVPLIVALDRVRPGLVEGAHRREALPAGLEQAGHAPGPGAGGALPLAPPRRPPPRPPPPFPHPPGPPARHTPPSPPPAAHTP